MKSSPAKIVVALTLLGCCWAHPTHLFAQGGADGGCARPPTFALNRGIRMPLVSTSDRVRSGMVIFPMQPDGSRGPPLQLPSWTRAGRLGPFVGDAEGNLYVAPVPNVNTLENPPEQQNWIYKVRTSDGELELFAKIPVVHPPSQQNPYGLLGLAYDCTLKVLYASTISGSTADKELGKIVALDTRSGRIISELPGVDAIGIGVGEQDGKQYLYFGRARSSEIAKVPLLSDGRFAALPVENVLRFDDFNVLRARKIRLKAHVMTISTTEFYYNLVAQTEFEQPTFLYELGKGHWNRLAENAK